MFGAGAWAGLVTDRRVDRLATNYALQPHCPHKPSNSGGDSSPGLLVLDVGVPGAILAVAMLATPKIVCDGIWPAPIGHFLSGDE